MNVPEINEVKDHLDKMKSEGLIEDWELPYENLLTRRSAAIFFVNPVNNEAAEKVWKEMANYDNFSSRENTEKTLSQLQYRMTFNPEEELQETAS